MKLVFPLDNERTKEGFGSTYEGLKLVRAGRGRDDRPRFGSTYEGLKRIPAEVGVPAPPGFGSTYEGLKLRGPTGTGHHRAAFWQYL